MNVRPYNGAGQLLTTPQTLHHIVFISQLLSREVKSVLVKHLYSAYQTTSYHVSTFLDTKKDIEELKSDLIRSHSTVIKLQAELLEIKSNQLESVQSTVQTTVQDTVQAGILTYSQAVSKASPRTKEDYLGQKSRHPDKPN